MLSEYELKRLTEDLKADPSLVVQVCNSISYEDCVELTYRLPNSLRKALMLQYRSGLSTRPGYVLTVYYPRRRVKKLFIEGVASEAEAKAHINVKGTNRKY